MLILPADREIANRGRWHVGWQNPDGSQRRLIAPVPVHRLDANGQWVERDDAVRDKLRFLVDGLDLSISLTNLLARDDLGQVRKLGAPDLSSPEMATDRVRFANIYPGVDWVYSLRPRGLKAAILIRSLPPRPSGFTWVGFAGTVSDLGHLTMAAPSVVDAKGQAGTARVFWTPPDFIVAINLDWLYGAALPVVLDPTINCEGNDISLVFVAGQPTNNQWRKCLVKFDISSIPDEATITAASLKLYVTYNGSGDVTLYSKRFDSQTWTEGDSVATLDAIAMGGNLDSHAENGFTTGQYYGFNVRKGDNSDGLEADVSGGNQYFTCGLYYGGSQTVNTKDNGTSLHCGTGGNAGSGLHAEFNSAEAGSNLPYLDVTYTVAGGGGFGVMV